MKALPLLVLFVLLAPTVASQGDEPTEAYFIEEVRATATNQRVDLEWDASGEGEAAYHVRVFEEGKLLTNRTSEDRQESFLLTNGRPYAFQVAARLPDGTDGPWSNPVAATPQLQNDLAYLAAGLITVWVGVFGYAAFLARKEASIDRKLEQLLQARFQGRSP